MMSLLAFFLATAAEPEHCTDLYSAICKPKTGATQRVSAREQIRARQVLAVESERENSKKHWMGLFSDPKKKDLRQAALRAFGLKNNPLCSDLVAPASSSHKSCDQELADKVFDLFATFADIDPKYELRLGAFSIPNEFLMRSEVTGEYREFSKRVSTLLVSKEKYANAKNHVLPEIKKQVRAVVNRLDIPGSMKMAALRKMSGHVLSDEDLCGAESHNIFSAGTINAGLAFSENYIAICNGMLILRDPKDKSARGLTVTLSHELSHSIGPCVFSLWNDELRDSARRPDYFAETEYPLKNLAKCLRHRDSIAARPLDSGAMKSIMRGLQLTEHETSAAQDCSSDQLEEVIPDWISAEVLGAVFEREKLSPDQSLEYLRDEFGIICRPQSLEETLSRKDSHPTWDMRINRVFAQQPAIRAALGCQPSKVARYCDAFHQEPQLTSSPASFAPTPGKK